ncbi:MAG: hypothetical protein K5893_08635 [Prevotella sp.]|nr:hypothetical protein [Prevotella sp.]
MQIVVVVLLIALLVFYFLKWRSATRETAPNEDVEAVGEKHVQEKTETGNSEVRNLRTRQLVIDTLKKLGCEPRIGEEEGDESIYFTYQGEHFSIDAKDHLAVIVVWDMYWESCDVHDIEDMSRMRRVINEANKLKGVTTFYTVNNESGMLYVHCKQTMLFIQFTDTADYLRAVLHDMFSVHHYVGKEMELLRTKEGV